MSDYIYLVQMDIPTEFEAEFNRIYDTQHVPNITKAPGVSACTRYKLESSDVEGVARYAAVYEIDSPDIRKVRAGNWSLKKEIGRLKYDRILSTVPTMSLKN